MDTLHTWLRDQLLSFSRDRRGNIALTFALAVLPVIGCVGAAIDYSHANAVKASLQSALDATALMLSKDAATLSDVDSDGKGSDLDRKAKAYFMSLFTRKEAANIKITASFSDSGGSSVVVNGSADVPTSIMEALGFDNIGISASSTAKWGSTRLRVALALDNTLSMASAGKMNALKTATKSLLVQLKSAAIKDGDIYVSIVPFNTDVNVGTDNDGADWIDFGSLDESCSNNSNGGNGNGWGHGNGHNNGWGHGNGNGGGSNCTQSHPDWDGCITDRAKSPTAYNVSNATPSVSDTKSLFPADESSGCPESVLPQTYDWNALKNKVDAMTPVGFTNTTIGLVHAWQTLTDGAPYSPPAIDTSDGIETQKVIIFLTDGENTQDRWGSNSGDIDDRMKAACANAKADNVTIFTVLVLEGNESLLKNCASDENDLPKGPKYFKLTSADQLVTAFNQIGTSLSNLRVAK